MEELGYKDKRVVVSGCYSGIGRATTELLLDMGAEVYGLDFRTPDLSMREFICADFRNPDSINKAVEEINRPIDALFNCAGVAPSRSIADILTINFFATKNLTKRLADKMSPGSAIVSVASIGGYGWSRNIDDLLEFIDLESPEAGLAWFEQHGSTLADAYSFTKQALAVWTTRESSVLIKRGIRINCTSPGSTQTPMLTEIEDAMPGANVDSVTQPIGRRSSPVEQAWPLLMLNSSRASYINGVDLAVDGGAAALRTMNAGK